MRTINEIKESIAAEFMRNEAAAAAYGFAPGDSFTATFSKVSVESILFYLFAASAWMLEWLFADHKTEVNTLIDEMTPHRPKWYRDKTLGFMKGLVPLPDTDVYDTSGMTAEAVASAMVVKHAVALESPDASILTIKVAGESSGVRGPLDGDTQTQLAAYLAEIKDAGVRISLVNTTPDVFNCSVDIYYDAQLLPEDIRQGCAEAIKNYIENLPFNGEYTNMALGAALQAVSGVKVVNFGSAGAKEAGQATVTEIEARYTPAAGYFAAGDITINMQPYEQV